ncbi:unnamed protein product, partial [Vitis vinifera]|uniref:Uncharacterized protein n=1 Tax=Vitis vinifera TaxID=29760 RepID=D7SJG6_VITVI
MKEMATRISRYSVNVDERRIMLREFDLILDLCCLILLCLWVVVFDPRVQCKLGFLLFSH